jgi:hypothetical protein
MLLLSSGKKNVYFEESLNIYYVLDDSNLKRKDHLRDLGVDGRIIL